MTETTVQSNSKFRFKSVAVGGATLAFASVPTRTFAVDTTAATTMADVTAVLTGLGALAGASLTLVLVPMAARMAIKIVNRVSVKG